MQGDLSTHSSDHRRENLDELKMLGLIQIEEDASTVKARSKLRLGKRGWIREDELDRTLERCDVLNGGEEGRNRSVA